MPLFTWGPQYSVLVDEMDNQHKQLFGYINDLNDAMAAGKGNEALGTILGKLMDYTKTHFGKEEVMLQKHNYPELSTQLSEHKKFIDKIGSIQEDLAAGKLMLSLSTLTFLRDWLQNHIMKLDRKYGDWMKENGIQ